ncbi:hypothetical protein [Natranaerofaba carboxydovora]|uniref:hypothetical protein n=1 Tax=Natranaerofaba carboxydovora TaxID=2742683 RepID=UPI001F137E3B|nr:hypothetical protein [Natranaerofaba carboxydovora]UMZ72811.1 hypothetical protein ACONDI_00341 [Natranaerofaba carboxydovora]
MGLNNKLMRIIVITILYVFLLSLPIFEEVQYTVTYYVMIILLLPITIYSIIMDKKLKKKFYKRWQKVREQGFWINIVREGMRSLVFMITLVSITQFIVNGRTPLEIISKLSDSALVWISLFLLAFNIVVGVIAWYENEKRYNRIQYALKNSN